MELGPIREALARLIPATWDEDEDDQVVLCGYAVVTEWVDAGGRRWINVTTGQADDEQLPPWTAEGLLGYATEHVEEFVGGEEDGE